MSYTIQKTDQPSSRDDARKKFLASRGYDGEPYLHAQDMSKRSYYRFHNEDTSFLVMDVLPPDSQELLILLSQCLHNHNLRAPQIYSYDLKQGFLLIEDFGDHTFTKVFTENIATEKHLYGVAIDILKSVHTLKKPFFIEPYSPEILLKEVEIFIDWYWLYEKKNKVPEIIKQDFMALWKHLFQTMPQTPQTLVLRDYHCDNLMVIKGTTPQRLDIKTCGILDFQDALWGSVAYDYVSLIEDARRTVSPEVVRACAEAFFKNFTPSEKDSIQIAGDILSLGRHFKILGVFTRYALAHNNASKCIHNKRLWHYIQEHLRNPLFNDLALWVQQHFPSTHD